MRMGTVIYANPHKFRNENSSEGHLVMYVKVYTIKNFTLFIIIILIDCVCICLSVLTKIWEQDVVSQCFFHQRGELCLTRCTNCIMTWYSAWFENESLWNSATVKAVVSCVTCEIVPKSFSFKHARKISSCC